MTTIILVLATLIILTLITVSVLEAMPYTGNKTLTILQDGLDEILNRIGF